MTSPDGSGPWPSSPICNTADRLAAIDTRLEHLWITVGRAPNAATGDQGSGMARVLAELSGSSGASQKKMIGAATIGAGGVVGLIEGLLAILRAFS